MMLHVKLFACDGKTSFLQVNAHEKAPAVARACMRPPIHNNANNVPYSDLGSCHHHGNDWLLRSI